MTRAFLLPVLVSTLLLPVAGAAEMSGTALARPDTVPSAGEVARLLAAPESREEGLRAVAVRALSLPPDRATLWIQLMATAERTGPEAGGMAAQAVARAEERDAPGGVDILLGGLEGEVPAEDRPALLALAGHLLEERDPARGAELRRRLIAEWPDALEAPEAQVLLARHLLGREGAPEAAEALELLEALLVRRPNHPLAPEARRLRQQAIQRSPR